MTSAKVHINDGFEEACLLMEAARVASKSSSIRMDKSAALVNDGPMEALDLDNFKHMIEPIVGGEAGASMVKAALEFDLQEEDWKHFMTGAKQIKYRKGQYVLQEGQSTAALYQIIQVPNPPLLYFTLHPHPTPVLLSLRTALRPPPRAHPAPSPHPPSSCVPISKRPPLLPIGEAPRGAPAQGEIEGGRCRLPLGW